MSNTYCPGCRNPLKLGRFTACPSCGYDLVTGRPGGSAAAAPINPVSRSFANHAYGPAQWPPASGLPSAPAPSLVSDLFAFHGRLNRGRYCWLTVLVLASSIFLQVFISVVSVGVVETIFHRQSGSGFFVLLFACLFVVGFWIDWSLTIKRLHDLDMPGTHLIWMLALGISALVLSVSPSLGTIGAVAWIAFAAVKIWLFCARGTNGDNKYGPPRVVFPVA